MKNPIQSRFPILRLLPVLGLFSTVAVLAESETDAAAESDLPSVGGLYRKHIDANGGRSNLQSIQTIIVKGKVVTEDETPDYKITVFRKRPNRVRLVSRFPNHTVESVWNGERGMQRWIGANGRTEEVEINAGNRAELLGDDKMDGPFLQLGGRDAFLEVEALEEVEGHPCVRLRVLRAADVAHDYIWLSLEHYQEVKVMRRGQPGADGSDESERSTVFDRFEQVDGVWFAQRIRYYSDDRLTRILHIESLRTNVGIYDSYFRLD